MAPTLCEGRYRVLNVLGEGGMSTVYAAHDERLGVQRAVKILSPALTHHASLRKRFEAEARTTARLRHPHIVTVHDVGTDHGRTFMVLELMPGGSLMSRVEAVGPMPPRMASETVISILSALQYAHEKGVIHRDVKPHNILVDSDGVPKLTDFGIARLLNSGEGLTRTGAAIGTPAYMAPEQRGNASQVDGRADIFSAGATLYTLLTGREPFDIYAAELQERLFADIPEVLRPVLRRATRYAAEDRYATGSAMLTELRSAIQQLPPDPEDALPLGAPLPDRIVPAPPRGTLTPDEPSQNTFDESAVDDRPEPAFNAFPSLSGIHREVPRSASSDIEHSLNTQGDEAPRQTTRTLLWLGLAAVLAAVVTGALLWRYSAPGASTTSTTPATPPDAGATVGSESAATKGDEPTTADPTDPATADPDPTTPGAGAAATTNPAARPSAGSVTPREETSSKEPRAATAGAPLNRPSTTTSSKTELQAAMVGSAGTGTLIITSKPKATLWLNDRHQGSTRFKGELNAGTWQVMLESEDGGLYKTELTVLAGQETSYCWDFKRADICDR